MHRRPTAVPIYEMGSGLRAGWYDALAWFGADEITGDVYLGKK
jgi:hypothetical protein